MSDGIYENYFQAKTIQEQFAHIREPLYLIQDNKAHLTTVINASDFGDFSTRYQHQFNVIGCLPALYPERLGCQQFITTHHTRFPYIIGAMANGITTAEMVIQAARIGCIGFFGAAGLDHQKVLENIKIIHSHLPQQQNWGSNLIHSPHEPMLEEKVTQLYLDNHVRRISASAYMQINPNIVYYACKGLYQDAQGNIHRQNFIFAKISRCEVAKQFMSPAPYDILQELLRQKKITSQEAQLAQHIPLAEDITVESDSGGHTDNRPLSALFSAVQSTANELNKKYRYSRLIRLGAAGGIGTPSSAASAFSLGAAYILTGSINQSSIESGLSQQGKELLLNTDIADITMAPAADMFELGVNVQVLKRGTLFAHRAKRLYELYQRYSSIEEFSLQEKSNLEKNIFKMPIAEVWDQTVRFFENRDISQLEKANKDPKHQMALIFRWYLGLSSYWAISGQSERTSDYQIWCGPAMGAFNHWTKGSVLEPLHNRKVAEIALNILEGAAIVTRAHQLRNFNISVPSTAFHFTPRFLS